MKWLDDDQLEGLIDEEAGGIIGYINHYHVDKLLRLLNKTNGCINSQGSDKYVEKFIRAIKTATNDEELKNIVNKIYEEGFGDAKDEGGK